jgi:hypothetical protein
MYKPSATMMRSCQITTTMKNIVFILFLSISLSGNSQNTYAPYPNGWAATWLYEHEVWNGTDVVYWYSEMIWGGDTVINNVTYKKAGEFHVRQNIPTEEAYLLDTNNVEHNIAFPHDAQVGDTILFDEIALRFLSSGMLPATGSDTFLIVETVGSSILQGQSRNAYHLNAPGTSGASFIEGVGFTGIGGFEHGFGLQCHSVNNGWIVEPNPSPFWPAGPYCVLGADEFELSNFKMYPNPTSGNVKFNLEFKDLISFQLVGGDGKEIDKSDYTIWSDGLDLSKIRHGVYFAQFVLPTGIITRRIIKQ